jgi:hypothetical protein
MNVKLSYEEFFKLAVLRLRNTSKSLGIHSVFTGFNQAFREYFEEDPIKVTQELAGKGKIEIRPVKGGVMIYLPGEAPKRADSGKSVLNKILKKPSEHETGLIEKVISEIGSKGIRKFPEEFLEEKVNDNETLEIDIPGTPLQLDPNSQTTIISPKRHYRYEARNPPEAKYIIYAYEIGQRRIAIPRDNRVIFKAVTGYEKYCQGIKDQSFTLFIKLTNDEEMAELLTDEIQKRLDLRAKKN